MAGEKENKPIATVEDRNKCARETRENLMREVVYLQNVIDVVTKENVIPDELIIPLHNLLLIVPRERFYFRERIIKLFDLLPNNIKSKNEVAYLIDRLAKLKGDDTFDESQSTDYAMYWSAYRKVLYTNGIFDNTKQEKVQKRMQAQIFKVATEYQRRRKQGIITATKVLGDGV